jgi:uncharacterized membrane protein
MVAKQAEGVHRSQVLLMVLFPLVIVLGFLLVPGAARAVFGFALVFFVPGFTLVYALFKDDEIDGIERLALSVGLSICIVIFDGLLLNYTPRGFTLDQIVISLSVISAVFTTIGYMRRRR